ncbi:MAG: sulfatase [Pseudomonadota bacterium]
MTRNTLFIILDDLNSWIGALGSQPDVKTPHIDALARRGVLFSRAYCSAPYCNASRMGLFTGLYPDSNGIYGNNDFWERADRPTLLMEQLREAGVYTIGAGKVLHGAFDYIDACRTKSLSAAWRELFNRDEIWDEFQSLEPDPLPHRRPLNGFFDLSKFDEIPKQYHGFDWGALPDEAESLMPDTHSVDYLIQFLLNSLREPFFCAAGLYKPHLPWHAPQWCFDLYDPEKLSLPLVKEDDLEDVPDIPKAWVAQRPDHETILRHKQWRAAVHGYLACISYADHQVGRLTAALSQSGLADTTEIILCSDNGFHLGEKLHWRKFVLWEEATRVPVIVASPDGPNGLVVDEPISLIDLHPTMLEAAGVKNSDHTDGVSLRPLIAGSASSRRTPPRTTWLKGNNSIRRGTWRYTRYSDGTEELYDHRTDPHEWTNLADCPTQRTNLDAFRASMDEQSYEKDRE